MWGGRRNQHPSGYRLRAAIEPGEGHLGGRGHRWLDLGGDSAVHEGSYRQAAVRGCGELTDRDGDVLGIDCNIGLNPALISACAVLFI